MISKRLSASALLLPASLIAVVLLLLALVTCCTSTVGAAGKQVEEGVTLLDIGKHHLCANNPALNCNNFTQDHESMCPRTSSTQTSVSQMAVMLSPSCSRSGRYKYIESLVLWEATSSFYKLQIYDGPQNRFTYCMKNHTNTKVVSKVDIDQDIDLNIALTTNSTYIMPYHNIPKDGHRSDVHATIHREQLSNDAIYIAYNDTRSNLASGNCRQRYSPQSNVRVDSICKDGDGGHQMTVSWTGGNNSNDAGYIVAVGDDSCTVANRNPPCIHVRNRTSFTVSLPPSAVLLDSKVRIYSITNINCHNHQVANELVHLFRGCANPICCSPSYTAVDDAMLASISICSGTNVTGNESSSGDDEPDEMQLTLAPSRSTTQPNPTVIQLTTTQSVTQPSSSIDRAPATQQLSTTRRTTFTMTTKTKPTNIHIQNTTSFESITAPGVQKSTITAVLLPIILIIIILAVFAVVAVVICRRKYTSVTDKMSNKKSDIERRDDNIYSSELPGHYLSSPQIHYHGHCTTEPTLEGGDYKENCPLPSHQICYANRNGRDLSEEWQEREPSESPSDFNSASNTTLAAIPSPYSLITPVMDSPKVLIVYSTNTPKKKQTIINSHLIAELCSYGIETKSHALTCIRESPSLWLEREITSANAVLCICNKEFKEDWEAESRSAANSLPLVWLLRHLVHATVNQGGDLSKYALVFLDERDKQYVPTKYLQGDPRHFTVKKVEDIANFVTNKPTHSIRLS